MQVIPIRDHLVRDPMDVVLQPESTLGWTMATLQPLPPGSNRYTNGQSSREPDPTRIFLPTMLVTVAGTISMESRAMSIRQPRTPLTLQTWLSGTANREAFGMAGMVLAIREASSFLRTEPMLIKVSSASCLSQAAPPLQAGAASWSPFRVMGHSACRMIHRHHRHRRRRAIRTMNSGVTTQAAGGIPVAVPVTGHRDNAVIVEPAMGSCANGHRVARAGPNEMNSRSSTCTRHGLEIGPPPREFVAENRVGGGVTSAVLPPPPYVRFPYMVHSYMSSPQLMLKILEHLSFASTSETHKKVM